MNTDLKKKLDRLQKELELIVAGIGGGGGGGDSSASNQLLVIAELQSILAEQQSIVSNTTGGSTEVTQLDNKALLTSIGTTVATEITAASNNTLLTSIESQTQDILNDNTRKVSGFEFDVVADVVSDVYPSYPYILASFTIHYDNGSTTATGLGTTYTDDVKVINSIEELVTVLNATTSEFIFQVHPTVLTKIVIKSANQSADAITFLSLETPSTEPEYTSFTFVNATNRQNLDVIYDTLLNIDNSVQSTILRNWEYTSNHIKAISYYTGVVAGDNPSGNKNISKIRYYSGTLLTLSQNFRYDIDDDIIEILATSF